MDPADLEWGGTRWSNFLAGSDDTYVMDSLSEDFEYVRTSLVGVRDDVMATDTRQSDNPNHLNPASSRGAPIGKVRHTAPAGLLDNAWDTELTQNAWVHGAVVLRQGHESRTAYDGWPHTTAWLPASLSAALL